MSSKDLGAGELTAGCRLERRVVPGRQVQAGVGVRHTVSVDEHERRDDVFLTELDVLVVDVRVAREDTGSVRLDVDPLVRRRAAGVMADPDVARLRRPVISRYRHHKEPCNAERASDSE
jgi:hypothetical protein